MKVQITHLKAPWPEGAGVGDVVELQAPELPAWALGKCTPAAADAPVFGPATGEPMTPAAGAALDAGKPGKAKRTAVAAG
jgi:hypothetical protein